MSQNIRKNQIPTDFPVDTPSDSCFTTCMSTKQTLRELIAGSGYTRDIDLANDSGVSLTTISRAKRGRSLSRLSLNALCQTLDCHTYDLEAAIEASRVVQS